MTAASNIRVFVRWTEQTVFAGEDIECQITFKNIAPVPGLQRSSPQTSSTNGFAPIEERRKATPSQTSSATFKSNLLHSSRIPPSPRGHRSTVSLTVPPVNGRFSHGGPGSERAGHSKANAGGHQHKRSLSIISMGASDDTANGTASEAGEKTRRSGRGHGRAASLQIVPGRNGSSDRGPLTGVYLAFRFGAKF